MKPKIKCYRLVEVTNIEKVKTSKVAHCSGCGQPLFNYDKEEEFICQGCFDNLVRYGRCCHA
jgi:formylmethanofuran dehydrogenase subunit E